MPIKSAFSFPIPSVSVPTYIFTSPTHPLSPTPLYISASHPETYFLTRLTYRLYAQRFASGLLRSGLRRGDRVLLYSGNTIFFPAVVMGIIMAGGIFTGANPGYTARELAFQLKDSGAKYLICAESGLDVGVQAAKECGVGAERVFVFDNGVATFEGRTVEKDTELGRVRHWTALLDGEEAGKVYRWPELRTEDELGQVVALNYSSGTTGVAKGVMITHRNCVANCMQQVHMSAQAPDYEKRLPQKRALCFLPMYHAMAQASFVFIAAKQGIPVYVMPRFDMLEMLAYVQRYRITDLTLVPPVIVALAKHPAVRKFDLSSVTNVSSGAAPLGREICQELEKLWPAGVINVRQGWGMTEVTCAATTFSPAKVSTTPSVGELLANCEAKIVSDDEGKAEVKRGEKGEIFLRGPNVMKGYWGKPEATKEIITADGWLRTGDVAYVDDDNLVYIVDRKKELIKVSGFQVAPAELEALLLDHPAVQDAAVIGVTIDGDELPRAYVVPTAGYKPSPELATSIRTWLADRVSKHKRLEGGVQFVDAVPKNPSGKILRKVLRDKAKQEDARAKL